MSGKGGGHKRNYHNRSKDKNKGQIGEKGKEVFKEIDDNNPIIQAFRQYTTEIDSKHDRYERLVKISRDITIESKRIIFLLHNVDNENKREEILNEAETRLKKIISNNFRNIAIELENQDRYQYIRAYSAGLQEFIEALTFYQYLKEKSIHDCKYVSNELTYNINQNDSTSENSEELNFKILKAHLPPEEYILGIADLTGELMRKCINNLGSGNIEGCFTTCNFVKEMYTGFLSIGNASSNREISRKAYVLKQSLHKMEHVCYNIVVRGSEVPKHMLANVISTSNAEVCSEDDEGYF